MIPVLHTRRGPQRAGYLLSILSMSAGWLFLLALTLDWSTVHWSRPAIILQVAALGSALLAQRVRAGRLVVYPVILAGSIYLWDTTLPPPNFPTGWPRELIPRLVLLGLLVDAALTVRRGRQAPRLLQPGRQWLALEDAARRLGITCEELRMRMQQRGYAIRIDAVGHEQVALDELHALGRPQKPAWWQLYVWFLLMVGLSVLMMWLSIPAPWRTVWHVVWSLLTLGGMSVWVRANSAALLDEDRARHTEHKQHTSSAPADTGRTIPLTPVQQRFLEIMERHDQQ